MKVGNAKLSDFAFIKKLVRAGVLILKGIPMTSRTGIVAAKLVLALSISLPFGVVSSAQSKDICQMWTHRGYPVEMGVCSYPNGGSGYTVITNKGNKPATICWTVVANNGNRDKSCHLNMRAGETASSSAAQCGTKTKWGGCRQIILESYKVGG